MAEIVQHLASGLQPPPESEPAAPAEWIGDPEPQ
jgi:hypothetical protein